MASPEARFDQPAPSSSRARTSQGPTSIQDAIEQLAAREARRLFAHAGNELELRQILAQIQKQQCTLQTRMASASASAPLRPSPAPNALAPTQPIFDYAMHALPHTVEELTAAQLRKVFDFIATGPTHVTPQPPTDPALLTTSQQQQAATVVYHLRQLDDALQCATSIFLNVQTFLLCSAPHASTGIITHRDLISDALLPNLFARSQPFLDALTSFDVSETLITEKSTAASAAVAHATRLMRTLEYHQLNYGMTRRKETFSAIDEEYIRLATLPEPEQPPVEPRTYVRALRWWQDNYDDVLHGTLTNEYLDLCRRDEPAAPEHQQPTEEQPQPEVQQQETPVTEQSFVQEEYEQPIVEQQQQVVTIVMAAHQIHAPPFDVSLKTPILQEEQQPPQSPSPEATTSRNGSNEVMKCLS
ncbi:unnamed protein product [Cylicocyclus nassatus]|uniref:Uncharacterized protein n=1 Tax=Cylicocyclus nassatus TaxID=53992 RepID=A0AA36HEZ4_CYLNA|nr:unnamed protein product [Cylicocyclus nassatus]